MATKTKDKTKANVPAPKASVPAMAQAASGGLKEAPISLNRVVPKRLVTLPQLKIVNDVWYMVKIEGAFYVGQKLEGKEGKEAQEPPTLANVVDIESGNRFQMIVNKVVQSEIERHFPDASYDGKVFAIQVSKIEGKRYKQAQVIECEVKEAD